MSDLVLQGLNLVLYGMGTVFVFLTLLVGATTLMSRLLREPPAPSVHAAASAAGETDKQVLAAVAAAVDTYRRRHP